MNVREESVRVHSFAENPYRADKMAIVSFGEPPDGMLIPNKKLEWLVQLQLSKKEANAGDGATQVVQLLFDTHFHGFSELGLPAAKPIPYIVE
jgi:hypothetical protein